MAERLTREQEPGGYAVLTQDGAFVGIWRDRAIAEKIANRGKHSANERICPMFFEAQGSRSAALEEALKKCRNELFGCEDHVLSNTWKLGIIDAIKAADSALAQVEQERGKSNAAPRETYDIGRKPDGGIPTVTGSTTEAAAPQGWVMVPREPTSEMIQAMNSNHAGLDGKYFPAFEMMKDIYRAMLAAVEPK